MTLGMVPFQALVVWLNFAPAGQREWRPAARATRRRDPGWAPRSWARSTKTNAGGTWLSSLVIMNAATFVAIAIASSTRAGEPVASGELRGHRHRVLGDRKPPAESR
jgi:hypothetical protein